MRGELTAEEREYLDGFGSVRHVLSCLERLTGASTPQYHCRGGATLSRYYYDGTILGGPTPRSRGSADAYLAAFGLDGEITPDQYLRERDHFAMEEYVDDDIPF